MLGRTMLRRRMDVRWVVAGAAVTWLCGCQAAHQSGRVADGLAQSLSLSTEARIRAEALAAFAQAQLDEAHQDPAAALVHYQQAAALDPDNEALQMKVALSLLQRHSNQEALAILETLVRRHPRSEQALSWLALTYQSTDRGEDAARIYQRLIRIAPRQPSGYLKLAAIYSRQGKDQDALRWLQRGLAQMPAAPEICKALADLYARRALVACQPAEVQRHRRRALELMEQACRAAPDDTELRSSLGELYIADGQFEQALAAYKIIEDRSPGQLPLKSKLAQTFAAPDRREQTVACFEKLAVQRPQDERLQFYLGELHDAAGHAEQAQTCFQRAATMATNATPVSRLALWHIQHSQTNEAIAAIQQGLRRWPDDPGLLQMRAYWHLAQKEYVQAIALFKKSLPQLKNQPAAVLPATLYLECAAAALKSGHLDEAAELLVQCYALDEDSLDAFCRQAASNEPDGLRRTALVLQKVAALLPDNPQPLILLGQLRLAGKDYAAAIPAFERAQALAAQTPAHQNKLDTLFYFLFGSACERQGQFERAEQLFFRCLERDDNFAEALNYLAYMWCEKGLHLDRALQFVQKALQLEPDNGAYLDSLGWIYYQQGRYHDALAPLKKAVELIPDDATLYDHLGDLHLKLNDQPQAIHCWTTAYQLDSTNAGTAQKLRARGLDPERLLQTQPPVTPGGVPATNAPALK